MRKKNKIIIFPVILDVSCENGLFFFLHYQIKEERIPEFLHYREIDALSVGLFWDCLHHAHVIQSS